MDPLCMQYSLQSSSMADSWTDSEEKPTNKSIEDMKEDEDDERQVASQKFVSDRFCYETMLTF